MEEIINKVANSGLTLINLDEIKPKEDRAIIDLKEFLWEGMILREKDFREKLKAVDWQQYKNKFVGITCSEEVIIPLWANMLVASYLVGIAKKTYFGKPEELETKIFQDFIASINPSEFEGARIVIKGCSKEEVPASAYIELIHLLQPVAKSIFFGEPCSTVPIYKKK